MHEIILQFDVMRFKEQSVFVLSFLDEITGFQDRNQGGLEEFLRYWDVNGEKLVVKDAQNKQSIRILTIHKSKGLEFNIVLLPFFNWDIYPAAAISPILWCKNRTMPSESLKVLPIKYEKDLSITTFSPEYYAEKVHNVIDNLNLIYVAFTRAIEGLVFITVKKPSKTKRTGDMSTVSQLVRAVMESNNGTVDSGFISMYNFFNEENQEFSYGDLGCENLQLELQEEEPPCVGLHIHKAMQNIKVKQNIKSKFRKYKDGKHAVPGISPAKMGILLHRVFENLDTLVNLPQQMNELVKEGWVNDEQSIAIQESVKKLIQSGRCNDWFREDVEVIKENEIITPDGQLLRPDRVVRLDNKIIVIDYKFGMRKRLEYEKKMNQYIDVVKSIYSETVEGVLWYILLDEIHSL